MDTSQFLAEFGTIAAAPNGVQRLREMILQLAVMGKLVPQDPADEPASVLLQRIAAEKDRLIRDGTIKRPKPLPAIRDDEKPFELPHGWEWTKLGEYLDIVSGVTLGRKNLGDNLIELPYLRVANVKRGFLELYDIKTVLIKKSEVIKYQLMQDDLLVTEGGDWDKVGRTAIWNSEIPLCIHQNHIIRMRKLSDNFLAQWIEMYMNSFAKNYFQDASKQTTNLASINMTQLKNCPLVIAPLAEQQRIVAKVDSLMALCDKLETLQQQRQQLDSMTQTAVLDALLPSPLAGEGLGMGGASAWQRLNQHMTTLFHTPESVKALRETILQLAVMGKLVPQDPNDEPAAMLLQHIATEKDRLIQAGKIKRQKSLSAIENSETLPELPKGWEIVNFGTYAQEVSTGPFGSMIHKSDYIQNGIPLINPSHMLEEKIVPDFSISVSIEKAEELTSYKIYQDDLVISRRGEMGRCALVDERSSGWLCGTGSFFIRFASIVDRQFILLLFKSKTIRDYLGGNSVGTTMTNLNHGILNNMPVLIPPLAEQQRIVAKVDSLMALCDKLETRLQAARETARLFAAEAVATM